MRSVKTQTTLCISPACGILSEIVCNHCSQQYCKLCFMYHRKNVFDDMHSIHEQMSINCQQGIAEVTSFIDQQAKDAHEQANKLIDDAMDRIAKAAKNIHVYIENRRKSKLDRLEECLSRFHKDAKHLEMLLRDQTFSSAENLLELRHAYAYNMFDEPISTTAQRETNEIERRNEEFFDDYRYYKELINLRQKWKFFQPALTTVYYPQKKEFSLDNILRFLEYRHDRVLENYREYLSKHENSKELSLKPTEALLDKLSFLIKPVMLTDYDNFTDIDRYLNEVHTDDQECSSSQLIDYDESIEQETDDKENFPVRLIDYGETRKQETDNTKCSTVQLIDYGETRKQETNDLPKIVSENCDAGTVSDSNNSWEIEYNKNYYDSQ